MCSQAREPLLCECDLHGKKCFPTLCHTRGFPSQLCTREGRNATGSPPSTRRQRVKVSGPYSIQERLGLCGLNRGRGTILT